MRVAAGVALLASGAAAAGGWTRTASPDGLITAETPCSAAEITYQQRIPPTVLPGLAVPADGRVLCRHGRTLFVAAEQVERGRPSGAGAYFDRLVVRAKAADDAQGSSVTTAVDGHRLFLDREAKGEDLAVAGELEIDQATVLMIVAGVQPGSGMDAAARGAAVDRFVQSIRVAPEFAKLKAEGGWE